MNQEIRVVATLLPAAPPRAFPKVEFTICTLSITPSSSSVPLSENPDTIFTIITLDNRQSDKIPCAEENLFCKGHYPRH